MPKPLYHQPFLYRRVFGPESGEDSLFARLAGSGVVLDAACGALPIESIPGAIGLDILPPAEAPCSRFVAADLFHLPFQKGVFRAIVSRLFGVAYAAAAHPGGTAALASELGRVLQTGDACAALELPVAYRPRRLQGIEEYAELEPDLTYRFRYLDIIDETAWGGTLATLIEIRWQGDVYTVDAPLLVFTPDGAKEFLRSMGLECRGFFAPYDEDSGVAEPPADVLRAVVWGTRPRQGLR